MGTNGRSWTMRTAIHPESGDPGVLVDFPGVVALTMPTQDARALIVELSHHVKLAEELSAEFKNQRLACRHDKVAMARAVDAVKTRAQERATEARAAVVVETH